MTPHRPSATESARNALTGVTGPGNSQRGAEGANRAITFVVSGLPAPQGSKAHVGNGKLVESSKGLAPWRQAIAIRSHNAMVRAKLRPFTGAVRVRCEFVMKRPQRCPLPTPPATKRPDCDKLARGLLDGITRTVIVDDSLVTELFSSKRIAEPGEPTGVLVTVEEIG